jgi:general transcription factor 3C polypeptide 5 (transcription factor C subunit 1)
MKPHSATVRTTTSSGRLRLINSTRHKTRALQTILFVQPTVPSGPEEAYLKELGRTGLTEIEQRLRGLLEERPVWVRAAMLNQLTPEEMKAVNVYVASFVLAL